MNKILGSDGRTAYLKINLAMVKNKRASLFNLRLATVPVINIKWEMARHENIAAYLYGHLKYYKI